MPGMDIGNMGGQILSNAAGFGLGILSQNMANDNQLYQQGQLINQQEQAQKELTDYSYAKQLQMWKDTNYSAQVEQMNKAGINPALLYGKGGGMGATTGTAGATGVSGGQAQPQTQMMQGMALMSQQALQAQLQAAQIKNIEADTANKAADTANKPKVGANIEASTANLIQGIQNQKAQQALTEAQTNVTKAAAQVAGGTIDAAIQKALADTTTAIQNAKIAMNEAQISDNTIKDKTAIIKQQAIGEFLDNILKRTDNTLKQNQIDAIKESVKNMESLRQLQWTKEERSALHGTLQKEGVDEGSSNIIDKIVDGIISMF